MPLPLHFDTARVRLARVSVSADHTLADALHDTAVIAAEALAVGRVSVWRYVNGRQAIRCDFLYQPGQADVSAGAILDLRELPMYARLLGLRRVVPVDDAQGDSLGDEFRASYFEPLGITAMLDAPVYHQGDVTGIVCHEHLSTPRVWSADEEELAGAVAETVARVYDEAELVSAKHSLGTYRQQVEHLRHLTALGQMAAGMAHDFGNVLMVADAHAEQLRDRSGDEAVRADLQSILDANARGHRLVHALLRLARPSSLRPRVVDVSAVVQNAAPMMRMAAGATATLTLDLAVGLPRVLVDPAELERSLVNLVINARDASPDGGAIVCRVFDGPSRPGAAPVVTIELRDTGRGMDAATLARAFEPFYTTKGDAGTGLGLAVVEQAIVMAGGSVDAESSPGAGTTVRLRLPAIAAPMALA